MNIPRKYIKPALYQRMRCRDRNTFLWLYTIQYTLLHNNTYYNNIQDN